VFHFSYDGYEDFKPELMLQQEIGLCFAPQLNLVLMRFTFGVDK